MTPTQTKSNEEKLDMLLEQQDRIIELLEEVIEKQLNQSLPGTDYSVDEL